jgi:dipeptidyl-peptidase 4
MPDTMAAPGRLVRLFRAIPLAAPLLLLFGGSAGAAAATPAADATARYDRALQSRMAALAPLVLNATLTPHWRTGAVDRFSYRRDLGDGAAEFVEIEAATGKRRVPFDARLVAAGMTAVAGKPVDPLRLPFVDYDEAGDAITFTVGADNWLCAARVARCTKATRPVLAPAESLSPDGKWVAFVDSGNLWIRSADGRERFALTSDAKPRYGYGLESEATIAEELFGDFKTPAGTAMARTGPPIPPSFLAVKWSPDSQHLLTHRLDERRLRDIAITQHAPTDGSSRPITWTWKSAAPNDAVVPMAEPWVFDIASRRGRRLAVDPVLMTYLSPEAADQFWWQPDSRHAALIRWGRYKKSISLSLIDTQANSVSTPITETGSSFVEESAIGDRPRVAILRNGDIVWYSQRSGHGHLYLYNGKTGALKRQLTRGTMAVSQLLHIDEANGLIHVAMTDDGGGTDPYRRQIYSVRLADGRMTLLTAEAADHHVLSERETLSFMKRGMPDAIAAMTTGFAPSGRYFIDAVSSTELPTRFVLRRANGSVVTTIETTDVGRLAAKGWRAPERFSAPGADGKTIIWGTLWKPHDFDPAKRYAVLDSDYPGPQITRSHPDFAASVLDFFDPQMYAELGLVVVAIDGRGTPGRSKLFQDYSYGRLGDAGGLDDHIAVIGDLAHRHSWIDSGQVGIIGSSGGGFAAARALFRYPDFYKVGVSDAGNHDQRGYLVNWGETYLGPDTGSNYADAANAPLASNLKGKLLLLHGDMDANVPPALTLQVADALVRANKDFEMLIVPNVGHGTLYSVGKPLLVAFDFLTRHLVGIEPPAGYLLPPPPPTPAPAPN